MPHSTSGPATGARQLQHSLHISPSLAAKAQAEAATRGAPCTLPWVCPCPAQSPGGDHASMQGAARGQEQEQEQEPLPSLPCRPVRCAAGRGRTASLPPDHAVLKVGPRQLVRSWAAAAVTLVVASCGLRLRAAARQPIDGRWMEVGRCGRRLWCRDLTLPSVGI